MTDDVDVCPTCSGTIGWRDAKLTAETSDSNSHNYSLVECLGCGDMYPSKVVLRLCFE